MQSSPRWCAAFAVALLGVACSQSAQEPVNVVNDLHQNRVTGEYLVTLAAGADAKAIAKLYGRFGIKRTRELGNQLFLVTFAEDPGLTKLEELRKQNPDVKAVQPNFVYRATGRGAIQ